MEKVKSWGRDIAEVLITLAVILIVLRLLLGVHMPVPLVAVVSCSMLHEDDVLGSISYVLAQFTYPILLEDPCSYGSSRYWRDWIKQKIPGQEIEKFPLKSGFSVGDMILVITPDGGGTILPLFSKTKVGDVVIFNRDNTARGNEPIIHRVVGIVKVKNWKVDSIDGTLDCLSREKFEKTYILTVTDCQQGAECRYRDFPKGGEFEFYVTKGDNNPGTDQCSSGILPINNAQVTARGWIRIPYVGWLKLVLNRVIQFWWLILILLLIMYPVWRFLKM